MASRTLNNNLQFLEQALVLDGHHSASSLLGVCAASAMASEAVPLLTEGGIESQQQWGMATLQQSEGQVLQTQQE